MAKFKLLREVFEPTEKEIKKSIRRYLNIRGIFNFNQWQGQFSEKGISDLIGLLPRSGRLLAIEVKRPGKGPTEDQQRFIDNVNRSGGLAFVATSVEDVIKNLDGGKRNALQNHSIQGNGE